MREPKPPKYKTSINLTQDAKKMLIKISKQLGVSHTAVIELAIRELASKGK